MPAERLQVAVAGRLFTAAGCRVLGEHRKAIGDGDLRRIVAAVRAPASGGSSASTAHVEAVGYGHGV